MARALHKLSALYVTKTTKPGRHGDGGGLYLDVYVTGSKQWVFRYRWKSSSTPGAGRIREMGLGSLKGVSLAQARDAAALARSRLAAGVDPISAKRLERPMPMFSELADILVETKRSEGNADKSIARLKRSLEGYAKPLRDIAVDQIDTNAVIDVLRPIWSDKPETAQKVRGHIEAVLDSAKARGFRQGENPARWKGHLDHLLARHGRRTSAHYEALPWNDLPDFFAKLRDKGGQGARALEFTILTCARSGETFGATWDEIHISERVWTIPAERMKEKREHRVPLTDAVMALIGQLPQSQSQFVFPGAKAERLSPMTMTKVLRDLGRGDVTVHGFRSTFRDWVGDATEYDGALAEAALSHAVGDKTERAYRRGDALERRRAMMTAWTGHCSGR